MYSLLYVCGKYSKKWSFISKARVIKLQKTIGGHVLVFSCLARVFKTIKEIRPIFTDAIAKNIDSCYYFLVKSIF